jgi:hypothetical protein
MQMIQSMGGTPVWPLIALSNIAQASAVVGIIIASRKQNEREISVPAAISAYLGVTEPAMYGINLKYRFPMLCAMIGSGLAGLLCGLNGVMANGIGVGGLPGILSIQPTYWQVYALAMAIAVVVPIVLTTGLSAQVPSGHLTDCLIFFRGALAPLVVAGKHMNTLPTGGKTALFIKFIRRVSRTRPAAVPAICAGSPRASTICKNSAWTPSG